MLVVVRKAKFEGKRKEKPVRENSLSMSGEKGNVEKNGAVEK